jgi:hypothetical protein
MQGRRELLIVLRFEIFQPGKEFSMAISGVTVAL